MSSQDSTNSHDPVDETSGFDEYLYNFYHDTPSDSVGGSSSYQNSFVEHSTKEDQFFNSLKSFEEDYTKSTNPRVRIPVFNPNVRIPVYNPPTPVGIPVYFPPTPVVTGNGNMNSFSLGSSRKRKSGLIYLTKKKIKNLFSRNEVREVCTLIPYPEEGIIYKYEIPENKKNDNLFVSDTFLWNGLQICTDNYTPSSVTISLNGEDAADYSKRTAQCKGVKICPRCDFVCSFKEESVCPEHNLKCKAQRERNQDIGCPVKIAFLLKKRCERNTQYLFRIDDCSHNHSVPTYWRSNKVIQDDIYAAFKKKPSLTSTEIYNGLGLGYPPALFDPTFQKKGKISDIKKQVIRENFPERLTYFPFFENIVDEFTSKSAKLLNSHIYSDCQYIHIEALDEFKGYIISLESIDENDISHCTVQSTTMSEFASIATFLFTDTTFSFSKGMFEHDIVAYVAALQEYSTVSRTYLSHDNLLSKIICLENFFSGYKDHGFSYKPGNDFNLVADDESAIYGAWIDYHENNFENGAEIAKNCFSKCIT